MAAMIRRLLPLLLLAVVALLAPGALAQEEAPAPAHTEEPAETVNVPEPAVEVNPAPPAPEEQAWTFRYLIPTSLLIAVVAVVGSIIAYFVKVVRTRYRVVQ